jgi:hypothetical protein
MRTLGLVGLTAAFLAASTFASAATDERVEVIGTIAADGSTGVFFPSSDEVDPCGGFGYDAATEKLTALALPPYLPRQFATPQNAWIALRFPFKVDDAKAHQSTFDLDSPATNYLSTQVTITDEFGNHVPVTPILAGKTAFGLAASLYPGFPYYPSATGANSLEGDRVLVLIADSALDSIHEPGVFGAALDDPNLSVIAELRIRVGRIGKHEIDGFWVIKVGDGSGHSAFPLAPLFIDSIAATKPLKPAQYIGGNFVIDAQSAIEITFSEPVEPWSVGVGKALAKSFAIPWKKNLKPTIHPCFASTTFPGGDPIVPNLELIADPDGKAKRLAFDVLAPNPDDLSRFRVKPVGALPKGVIELRAARISEQPVVIDGNVVSSATTARYGRAFDDENFAAVRFHVTSK